MMVDSVPETAWRAFTLSNEFVYMSDERGQPQGTPAGLAKCIPFHPERSFVRLSLSYQPLRDNIPVAKLCGEVNGDTDSEQCVSQLWNVRIAGREVPIDDFVVAERMDISIRGLPGLVPLSGLQPGIHVIEVIWNRDPDNTAVLLGIDHSCTRP